MLNIKDPETDRLVRQLAEKTGESITEAVRNAVRERLGRTRSPADTGMAAALMAIAAQGRRLMPLTNKTPDEIIGYDNLGVPSA